MKSKWNEIKDGFHKSPNKIIVIEKNNSTHCDTVLDIVVNNALIIIVNKYLRLFCSGDGEYENILKFNDKFKNIIGENKYSIAHDVWGGIFALTPSGICYLSPDTLQWEDLDISYEGFIEWILRVIYLGWVRSICGSCQQRKWDSNISVSLGKRK